MRKMRVPRVRARTVAAVFVVIPTVTLISIPAGATSGKSTVACTPAQFTGQASGKPLPSYQNIWNKTVLVVVAGNGAENPTSKATPESPRVNTSSSFTHELNISATASVSADWVVISASLTLTAGISLTWSQGSSISYSRTQLTPPGKEAYVVEEIPYLVSLGTITSATAGCNLAAGGSFRTVLTAVPETSTVTESYGIGPVGAWVPVGTLSLGALTGFINAQSATANPIYWNSPIAHQLSLPIWFANSEKPNVTKVRYINGQFGTVYGGWSSDLLPASNRQQPQALGWVNTGNA
jgi:hypothetical protein